MINKQTIQTYLNQRTTDHTWVKTKDAAWFEEYIAPTANTTPWLNQLACTYLGMKYPTFGFFLKMALGKSKIVLDVIQQRMQTRPHLKTLILVPYLINLSGWETQLKTHAPTIPSCILTGSSQERIAMLQESDASIYVLNYAGFTAMVSSMPLPIKCKKGKKKKVERVVDLHKLQSFCEYFDVLVMDESTTCKNHQSLTYKACLALSYSVPFRYLLTGTPFGKNQHDIWAQYMILDHGETFGKTLSIFRGAFFSTKVDHWGKYTYTFKPELLEAFTHKLHNKSISYALDECLDLPPQIETPLYLTWDDEAKAYYDAIHKSFIELVRTKGDIIQITKHFMRLRQITSGFLMHKDEDATTIIHFTGNPKRDALLELLTQADPADKFVVFHFFVHTGELISDALRQEKIIHSRLWSGTPDKAGTFNKFITDPTQRVLVLNEQIGALGLNIQAANYLIFFEPPVSPITREQAEARCRRPGQTKTVFCYDLLIQQSKDEEIYESVRAGKDFLQTVLENRSPS